MDTGRREMNSNNQRSGRSKIWLLPALAAIAGTGIGASTSLNKYQEPDLTVAGHTATAGTKPVSVEDAEARVYLPGPTEYDFGVMARDEEQSHTFKVQNIGSGPLTLKVANTTCKCTVGSLERDSIAPQETADVTLTWETLSYDREFRQSATIETNDQTQREIVFTVTGQVLQLALPDRPMVKFSRISRSEPQQFEVKVYAYRDEDFVIVDHLLEVEETAHAFSVTTERLPKEQWEDDKAKSAVLVKVDIAPGLPLGICGQVIQLETNKPDIAPIDIVVNMTVISDISILGPVGFNAETNVLSLGVVPQAQGKTADLHLMVKGPHVADVEFSIAEIVPQEALQIEIGDPVDINSGAVRRFPAKVIVPPNSPNVTHMGNKQSSLGRIKLNTNHPEIEQFDIRVQFVVQ